MKPEDKKIEDVEKALGIINSFIYDAELGNDEKAVVIQMLVEGFALALKDVKMEYAEIWLQIVFNKASITIGSKQRVEQKLWPK